MGVYSILYNANNSVNSPDKVIEFHNILKNGETYFILKLMHVRINFKN